MYSLSQPIKIFVCILKSYGKVVTNVWIVLSTFPFTYIQ